MLRLRTLRSMSGASPVVVRGWTDWKTMRNLGNYCLIMFGKWQFSRANSGPNHKSGKSAFEKHLVYLGIVCVCKRLP